MHIFYSGIGGTGIGPLSLIAHEAGYEVSGSDKQDSTYLHYLKEHGITDIHIGQSYEQLAAVHARKPIDWLVYSSAIVKEQSNPPELRFCQEHNIRTSKRDEFLSSLLEEKHLKMLAIAGTHGKTTTTAMTVWLFTQLGLPESHSVAAKMSFAEMGAYDPKSMYFIYEADEYDRNFLAFRPRLSMITGIGWDHPDVFPSREDYNAAFHAFLEQSEEAILWDDDMKRLNLRLQDKYTTVHETDPDINTALQLPGFVNRKNAWEVAHAVQRLTGHPLSELLGHLNHFPGVSRRFETIAPHIISDYAHTPEKIQGALQTAHELGGDNVIIIYEGLHNTRQHFIRHELSHLFDNVKQLYIVPSYLAREDKRLALLSPADLKALLSPESQAHTTATALDDSLVATIQQHADAGDLVVCISAGGGGSLDEWLRKRFTSND